MPTATEEKRGPGRPSTGARDRVLEAGLETLLEEGYAGLSYAKVAEKAGENKSLIETADEYARAVRDVFGVECPDAQKLWPAIMRRHLEIFESASAF